MLKTQLNKDFGRKHISLFGCEYLQCVPLFGYVVSICSMCVVKSIVELFS